MQARACCFFSPPLLAFFALSRCLLPSSTLFFQVSHLLQLTFLQHQVRLISLASAASSTLPAGVQNKHPANFRIQLPTDKRHFTLPVTPQAASRLDHSSLTISSVTTSCRISFLRLLLLLFLPLLLSLSSSLSRVLAIAVDLSALLAQQPARRGT